MVSSASFNIIYSEMSKGKDSLTLRFWFPAFIPNRHQSLIITNPISYLDISVWCSEKKVYFDFWFRSVKTCQRHSPKRQSTCVCVHAGPSCRRCFGVRSPCVLSNKQGPHPSPREGPRPLWMPRDKLPTIIWATLHPAATEAPPVICFREPLPAAAWHMDEHRSTLLGIVARQWAGW